LPRLGLPRIQPFRTVFEFHAARVQHRLDDLDEEEAREVAAIEERYAEVKPHTTAAAIVFALTPEDAKAGLK